MLNSTLEAFGRACDACSQGWLDEAPNRSAIRCYRNLDSSFGFQIELTEARVHLSLIKDCFLHADDWNRLCSHLIRQFSNWSPLEVAFWNGENLAKPAEGSNIAVAEGITKIEFSSPLFDIGDYGSLRSFIEACFEVAGVLSDLDICAGAVDEGGGLHALAKRYERSKTLRKRAIAIHGSNCAVCGFSFSAKYGDIGNDFIHIHHIERLADTGKRLVNPATDLVPVCPNCHSMLHRKNPPLLPEQLRDLLKTVT